MNVAALLERFDRVRKTGPNSWIAPCPAHQDRNPSLSIRELPDGRILVHDFAGCATADILAAIGLSLSDLFEKPLLNPASEHGGFKRERRPFHNDDALRSVAREAMICALAASDAAAGKPITEADAQRVAFAVGRITAALDATGLTP